MILPLTLNFGSLEIYWPDLQGLVGLFWCIPSGACQRRAVGQSSGQQPGVTGQPHAAAPGVSCSARLMPYLSRSGRLGCLNFNQLLSILAVQGAWHRVTPAFIARPVCPADAVHCIKPASRPALQWPPDYFLWLWA